MTFDIAIIGGGPGGYTAAEKAAKEGLSVVLFEQDRIGGTCLNRGCIPTKALLHTAEAYAALADAEALGIHVENISVDFAAMHRRKDSVVSALRQGVEKLMKANKVTVVSGTACIQAPSVVSCNGETYEVKDILIATGSKVFYPPIPGIHGPGVYNSDDLLEGEGKALNSLVIIGGGRGMRLPVPGSGLRGDDSRGGGSHPAAHGPGDRPAAHHVPEEAGHHRGR